MAFSRGKINIQMAFHAFLKKDHSILIIGFYGSVNNLSKVVHISFFLWRHFCMFLADMKNGTIFSFDHGPFLCAGKYFPLWKQKMQLCDYCKSSSSPLTQDVLNTNHGLQLLWNHVPCLVYVPLSSHISSTIFCYQFVASSFHLCYKYVAQEAVVKRYSDKFLLWRHWQNFQGNRWFWLKNLGNL